MAINYMNADFLNLKKWYFRGGSFIQSSKTTVNVALLVGADCRMLGGLVRAHEEEHDAPDYAAHTENVEDARPAEPRS